MMGLLLTILGMLLSLFLLSGRGNQREWLQLRWQNRQVLLQRLLSFHGTCFPGCLFQARRGRTRGHPPLLKSSPDKQVDVHKLLAGGQHLVTI